MKQDWNKTFFYLSSIQELSPESRFVVGYTHWPPDYDLIHGLRHKFSTSYFTHWKHRDFGGVLGSRYSLNANKGLVYLVLVRILFNEEESSWNIFNKTTRDTIPYFDDKKTDGPDAEKGGRKSSQNIFGNAKQFFDSKHCVDAIEKSAIGSTGVAEYRRSFSARS